MLIGLNGATTMKNADLLADIEISAELGYDFIEIWKAKLYDYLKLKNIDELINSLVKNNMKAYAINSIENITFRNKEDLNYIKEELIRLCEIANKIKCDYIVVVPSPKPSGVSREEIKQESISRLEELSKITQGYDTGLAFEFIGTGNCSVKTLDDAWQIVKGAELENVGLVVDAFHFYTGGSSIRSIKKIPPDKIIIFHINDCEDLPIEKLQDKHRLLPGEGVIPLREIAGALKSIGYNRVVSVELFRPDYWKWDAKKLAYQSKKRTEDILGGIF
jgi:2-keto-myo-inositol isomerase